MQILTTALLAPLAVMTLRHHCQNLYLPEPFPDP
jgi:hypothetical protein